MDKNIGFLFGSYISTLAGLPPTQGLTETVLKGENIKRYTSGHYDKTNITKYHDKCVQQIIRFLKILNKEIDSYYMETSVKNPNYEDIYYLIQQIEDALTGEFDNPGIQPLIDKLIETNFIINNANSHDTSKQFLKRLTTETLNYIKDIVWVKLLEKPGDISHLNIIKDAISDDELLNVDIYTLNHDKILENFLSDKFIDGFEEEDKEIKGLRFWNPYLFENKSVKTRVFKLHGSVDWFAFRPEGTESWNERYAIRTNNNPGIWHTNHLDVVLGERRPIFLIGTYNKMLNYIGGIYLDIYCYFYKAIRDSKKLVISGYSFGDKGINTYIIHWMGLSSDHRIILIHPNPDELEHNSRGNIKNKWDSWKKDTRLILISKGFKETSWDEIKKVLK